MCFTSSDQLTEAKQSIKSECNDTSKSTVGRKRVIQEHVCREVIGQLEALKHLYPRDPEGVADLAASRKKSRPASEAFEREVGTELESKNLKAEQVEKAKEANEFEAVLGKLGLLGMSPPDDHTYYAQRSARCLKR